MVELNEANIIELDEENIILKIPANTVELTVTAKIYQDGQVQEVSKHLDMSEVKQMRKNFLDELIDDDYDAKYCLTEEGLRWLEENS